MISLSIESGGLRSRHLVAIYTAEGLLVETSNQSRYYWPTMFRYCKSEVAEDCCDTTT